jgi:putative oxidoreductase
MLNFRAYPDVALLMLRLAAGFSFFMHGQQKFQVGIANVEQGFAGMGIPLPGLAAWLIAILETFGGMALMIGLLTRPVAALLFCDMLVATLLVHLKNGWLGEGGMELTALLGATAFALAVAGPGRYSLDERLMNRGRRTP